MSAKKTLSPKMERYCRLRLTGADPLDCMERAGYAMDQTADRRTLIKKANAYDRNPLIQDRIVELREQMALIEGEQQTGIQPHVFKHLDLGEGNEMSLGWVNQAAYTVYKQALSVDNFHQGLQTLKFIAELNGYIAQPKQGRPKNDKAPNDTQTGFNHDTGADTGSPEEDEGFALEFEGTGGSPRKKSAGARAPANNVQTNSRQSSQDVEDTDDGLDEFDQWDAGTDGEN
jgi:hypothetical protein